MASDPRPAGAFNRFMAGYLVLVGLVLVGFGLYTVFTGAVFDAVLALAGGLTMLVTVLVLTLLGTRRR